MKYIYVLLLGVLSFQSCEKLVILSQVIHGSVPECIAEEIEVFKAEMNVTCDEGASVIKYEFQGQIVYAFDMGICVIDGSSTVLNGSCEEVCLLGTIAGITDCLGESFENAIEIKVLWKQ